MDFHIPLPNLHDLFINISVGWIVVVAWSMLFGAMGRTLRDVRAKSKPGQRISEIGRYILVWGIIIGAIYFVGKVAVSAL